MRMIVLLVALLLVGLLFFRQLDVETPNRVETTLEDLEITPGVDTPAVPTRPQDVQKFGQEVSEFVSKAAANRAERLEQEQQ